MRSSLTRIEIRDFKSIHRADVPLTDLTVLIGPNGSGKSVFLEALTLVSDILRNGLNESLAGQGDIRRWRTPSARTESPLPVYLDKYAATTPVDAPISSTIKLHFRSANTTSSTPEMRITGSYQITIHPNLNSDELGWQITHEHLEIHGAGQTQTIQREGDTLRVNGNLYHVPKWTFSSKRDLYLDEIFWMATPPEGLDEQMLAQQIKASAMLSSVALFNPSPTLMRDRNKKSPSRRLDRLGSRLPSVWYQNLHNSRGPEAETILDYMRMLVPGLSVFRTDLSAEDMLFYFTNNEHPLLARACLESSWTVFLNANQTVKTVGERVGSVCNDENLPKRSYQARTKIHQTSPLQTRQPPPSKMEMESHPQRLNVRFTNRLPMARTPKFLPTLANHLRVPSAFL